MTWFAVLRRRAIETLARSEDWQRQAPQEAVTWQPQATGRALLCCADDCGAWRGLCVAASLCDCGRVVATAIRASLSTTTTVTYARASGIAGKEITKSRRYNEG